LGAKKSNIHDLIHILVIFEKESPWLSQEMNTGALWRFVLTILEVGVQHGLIFGRLAQKRDAFLWSPKSIQTPETNNVAK